jgi:hypothetical protein
MAQEMLHYQPTDGGHEGWLARTAELIAMDGEDPAQGAHMGTGAPDQLTWH